MKFFIDTAKVEDIKKANDMGVICGVTTNPSLIAKEGRVFEEVIAEIASIVDGPISGEVKATTVDAEGMIEEGRAIAKIHPNMISLQEEQILLQRSQRCSQLQVLRQKSSQQVYVTQCTLQSVRLPEQILLQYLTR